MLEYRCSSIAWKPSPVSAIATSPDDSQIAAARDDGSLEIWIVSPGSISWHCQLTIHGDPNSRVSSLAWCCAGLSGPSTGRLFSSSIDGSISEWDLSDLKQKIVLESIGVSIWQMAVAPSNDYPIHVDPNDQYIENGNISEITDDEEDDAGSESSDDSSLEEFNLQPVQKDEHVAIACDDGCVRIYSISDAAKLTYNRSLPRVSGRALSVTWNQDAKMIFSGSSDGLIRCWDANRCYEIYRITCGLGGMGSGSELCVWSLLSLRCGTLVSADSSGSVQFWDGKHGTLLQAFSNHKGDVNALATAPSHDRVFSAGSDGQVILYKFSSKAMVKKWDYISYVRAHTHDIKALTVAVPISRGDENLVNSNLKRENRDKRRRMAKDFTYHKWAFAGAPMLISAGDDAKLFAYSMKDFTKFSPHDICPAPQRVPIQMVLNTVFSQSCLLLVQGVCSLDIQRIQSSNDSSRATTKSLVCIKSKDSRKIICSAISSSGSFFAYSDQIRPSLFELKRGEFEKNPWKVERRRLPKLPSARSMVFSSDCSQLLIAGHDRKIYAVDVRSLALVHTFSPQRGGWKDDPQPSESPITKMYTSLKGHWLAAVNCFGDIYIFNLATQRQHWFISRLDGACVVAAGFHPRNNNVLVITTSSNQIIVFDVEAKQLVKLSSQHADVLSKMSLEFPSDITGLSFSPAPNSSSVIIYSSRAKCMVDLGMAVENGPELPNGNLSKKLENILLLNGGLDFGMSPRKRRFDDYFSESNPIGKKSSEIQVSKHPALFVGHLSKNSILVIEKPWIEVVKSLDTRPVHRHVFGT